MTKFGDTLRMLREQKGLRQSDVLDGLSARGQKKYSHGSIIHWEKGRTVPPMGDPEFVKALADVLGVSETDLLNARGFDIADGPPPKELPPEAMALMAKLSPDELSALARLAEAAANAAKRERK